MRLLLALLFMFLHSSTAFRPFGRSLTRSGRLFSVQRSLDVQLIASDREFVLDQVKRRGLQHLESSIDRIGEIRKRKVAIAGEINAARKIRNSVSKEIGKLMQSGQKDAVAELKAKAEQATSEALQKEVEEGALDIELNNLLNLFPNLLDEGVPHGTSEADNVVVSTWGTPKVGDGYQWHDDVARGLNGFDTDSSGRIAGARFSVLLGSVAKLERALVQYFLDFHTSNNYTEVSVPYIVSRSTLFGTGQLPKFEEDLFMVNHKVTGEDAFLIPTAEVPVTNLFRDQILLSTQVPVHLVCHTPCFRAEAGSTGRDTRGLLRQHQFQKVELVKICTAETSEAEHEAMTRDVERLLESLELPYRKLLLCDADTGFSASKCYDIEVWFPGQQQYREISSISNCKDFQSRRMKLKVRLSNTEYLHTLNGSGLAVGRALAAILENYQQSDGSVVIPKVLRAYMGGMEKLETNKRVLNTN